MAKSSISWVGLICLIAGIVLLYFNSTLAVCTGWSIINPFCWAGALITHGLMLFGGVILLIVGIIKLIKGVK